MDTMGIPDSEKTVGVSEKGRLKRSGQTWRFSGRRNAGKYE